MIWKTLGWVVIKIEWLRLPKESEIHTIIVKSGFRIISVYLQIKSAIGLNIDSTELINPKKNKPNSTDKYRVNSNEIEFLNGVYIRAVGSASSVRGANWGGVRPTVVILDNW